MEIQKMVYQNVSNGSPPPKKYDILTSKVSLESEQKNICAEKKEETKDASLLSPVRGMYVLLDTFHVFLIFS